MRGTRATDPGLRQSRSMAPIPTLLVRTRRRAAGHRRSRAAHGRRNIGRWNTVDAGRNTSPARRSPVLRTQITVPAGRDTVFRTQNNVARDPEDLARDPNDLAQDPEDLAQDPEDLARGPDHRVPGAHARRFSAVGRVPGP